MESIKDDKYLADRLIDSILDVSENEIEENDHVSVAINDYDFWFTPTHIAEIIELLKLKKKAAEERKAQPQTASKPNAKWQKRRSRIELHLCSLLRKKLHLLLRSRKRKDCRAIQAHMASSLVDGCSTNRKKHTLVLLDATESMWS